MSSLPILLVFSERPPPELVAALDGARLLHREAAPTDAAQSVNDGWADLVVCERVPGWQALVARVQAANGAAILWGGAPQGSELRLLSQPVPAASDVPSTLKALRAASAEITLRRERVESDDLRERAECAERVNRFAQSIALQIDLPHVVEEAIARTRDLCDADGASLLVVDPQTGGLTFDVVSGTAAEQIEKVQLRPGQGIAGHVARTAEPLLVQSVCDSAWFDASCDAMSGFVTGSVVAAPLVLGGDLVGVLEAVRGTDRPAFTQAHLRRLTELAPHVSIALHNAQITERLRMTQAQVLRDNQELERRIDERTRQIVRAKREWEATFDAMQDPIAVQDGFVVRRTNVAYARMAGQPITKIPGRYCYELVAGRDSPCPGCPLVENKAARAQIPGRDDQTFQTTAFALPEEQNRWVVHYADVTHQRQLERRLRDSERLASLGQLASGAAHEINNPLGFLASNLSNLKEHLEELAPAVSGGKQALRLLEAGRAKDALQALRPVEQVDDALFEDGAEMIDDSLSGARRVADIVRALRELSRQQMSTAGTADINAAITRALRSEGCDVSGAGVVLELASRAPAAIDPLQLDQAVCHLLRNARQAVTGPQRVFLRTRDEGSEVVMEVQDEGVGIPAENVGRVFEPFFTTRGVGRGIGLGLTATWGIIQRHAGRIDVHSEVGRGTTFTVRLPRVETEHPSAEEAAAH